MIKTNCPYTKISDAIAWKNFTLVPTAYAQESNTVPVSTISDQLTIPFFILILSFFLFVILMSVVYMYHWFKFSLNDAFIKSFIPIFFIGLIVMSIPLMFNLFF